jgi:hypothetical protein
MEYRFPLGLIIYVPIGTRFGDSTINNTEWDMGIFRCSLILHGSVNPPSFNMFKPFKIHGVYHGSSIVRCYMIIVNSFKFI